MRERSVELAAAEQLADAGFFVELNVGAPGQGAKAYVEADVLAWAGDEDGELVPDLVVEAKAKLPPSRTDHALAQLSRVAAVMGTRRAFFFDGRWHETDPTFTRFEDSDCPRPAVAAADARVPRRLIEREIWSMRDKERGQQSIARGSEWIELVVRAADGDANTTLSRLCAGVRSRVSLARILSESADEFGVPATLTDAMVRLLAPSGSISVLDPACRLGGALWAVAEVCPQATLQGWWPNESAVHAARALGGLFDARVDLARASFEEVLAKRVCDIPPSTRLLDDVMGDTTTAWLDEYGDD